MVIKFDWKILDLEIIDDNNIQNGLLEDVLNSESVERFNQIIGKEFDFGKLANNKIFHINSKDTVSYSRSEKKYTYLPFGLF